MSQFVIFFCKPETVFRSITIWIEHFILYFCSLLFIKYSCNATETHAASKLETKTSKLGLDTLIWSKSYSKLNNVMSAQQVTV